MSSLVPARFLRVAVAAAVLGFVSALPATAAAQAPQGAAAPQVDPSQVEIWDVIQTTDGNVLKGVIVEQSRVGANTMYKLVLPGGGGTMTIPDSKVARITKERNPARAQPAPAAAAYPPPPGAAPQQAPAAGYQPAPGQPPGAPAGGYPPPGQQGAPPGYVGYGQPQGAPPPGYAGEQQPGVAAGAYAAQPGAAPPPSDHKGVEFPPPVAVQGFRLSAQIGPYFPMSDLSNNTTTSFGGRIRFGYELMFGRLGLTPSIAVELASFSGENNLNNSSVFYLGVQPGLTAAVHLGFVAPYFGVTLGLDRYALTGDAADFASNNGADSTALGFGLGLLFGVDFVIMPSVSVGAGGMIHPGFTTYDPGFGVAAQDLGHAALLFDGTYRF